MSDGHAKKPLVRDLMSPSPSLEFTLQRRNEKGAREEHPFRARILRAWHHDEALVAAQRYAEQKEGKGYGDIYKEAQAVEILLRAILVTEPSMRPDGTEYYRPMFVTADQLRQSLDTSEMAQMLNAFHIAECYFGVSELKDGDVEALIDGLADEMRGPLFLSRLDSDDWQPLIFSLARLARSWRPEIAQTPSSSPSSSESDPSSSPSGTTGFSTLPAAHANEWPGTPLPTDKMLNRETAKDFVQSLQTDGKPDVSGDGK